MKPIEQLKTLQDLQNELEIQFRYRYMCPETSDSNELTKRKLRWEGFFHAMEIVLNHTENILKENNIDVT